MSIEFAEQLIESILEKGDVEGRCLSTKQYQAIKDYLADETEHKHVGGSSTYNCDYYKWEESGVIGKYDVEIEVFSHFHCRYTIKKIAKWIDALPDFDKSEYQGEAKKRSEYELTYIRTNRWLQDSYCGYGKDWVYLHTFADAEGNCYIWKTGSPLGMYVDKEQDGWLDWIPATHGDKIQLKATVKDHKEYKGIKQTVLTRCKVTKIN
jgi:hypothetical protein